MLTFLVLTGIVYTIGAAVWLIYWLIRVDDAGFYRNKRRHALRRVWLTPTWPAFTAAGLVRWLRKTWLEAWGPDPDKPKPPKASKPKPAEPKRTRYASGGYVKGFENYPKADK